MKMDGLKLEDCTKAELINYIQRKYGHSIDLEIYVFQYRMDLLTQQRKDIHAKLDECLKRCKDFEIRYNGCLIKNIPDQDFAKFKKDFDAVVLYRKKLASSWKRYLRLSAQMEQSLGL